MSSSKSNEDFGEEEDSEFEEGYYQVDEDEGEDTEANQSTNNKGLSSIPSTIMTDDQNSSFERYRGGAA